MKIKITTIHGFNVSDRGVGTVDAFAIHVKIILEKMGHEVVIDADSADYGRHLLLRANYFYWFGDTIERISGALQPDDDFDQHVLIAHSNGCNYGLKALKDVENPDLKIIFLSAAINRKTKFKQSFKQLANFHTFKDKIVGVSRFVPASSWGDGGQVGLLFTNNRIANYDFTNHVALHSDWSKDHSISKPAEQAVSFITEV
jgi:hypothetical protein